MRQNDNIDFIRNLNSKLILNAVYGLLALLILKTTFDIGSKLLSGEEIALIDFNTFYLVGWLFWQDKAVEAYHFLDFFKHQQLYYHSTSVMLWTYPPQFILLTATLALLPQVWAFLFFSVTTLSLYNIVLRNLAGEWLCICIVMIFPAMIVTLSIGQNGLLTASLAGLFVIGMFARRSWAGLPAGLLIIKPHLAAGLAILALIQRDWKTVVLALTIVITSTLAVIPILSADVWLAFYSSTKEATLLLTEGFYPLNRMVSVYAAAFTLGVPARIAFAIQAISAVIIIFLIIMGYRLRLAPKHLLALAVIAPFYISPYLYDYDTVLLGIAFALVMPELAKYSTKHEFVLLLVLSWISTGWGLVTNFLFESPDTTESLDTILENRAISISIFTFTALLILSFRILRRSYRV